MIYISHHIYDLTFHMGQGSGHNLIECLWLKVSQAVLVKLSSRAAWLLDLEGCVHFQAHYMATYRP